MIKRDKKITHQNLLAAIDRINEGTFTSKALLKKVKENKEVKLNISNVEKEAGMGVGAIRHHGGIEDIINGVEKGDFVSLEKYEELQDTVKKLKKTNRETLKASKKYQKKADDADTALNIELATQHQLVTALFHKVPIEEREELMKSIKTNSSGGNVTLISEHKKT
jgi:hypothetical protein